eukprot:5894582-Prymnesium_polylepis.1
MSKEPKIVWYQRHAILGLTFHCAGETGEPQMKVASDEEVVFKWGGYEFSASFTKPVDAESAEWVVGKGAKKGSCEVTLKKRDQKASYWPT